MKTKVILSALLITGISSPFAAEIPPTLNAHEIAPATSLTGPGWSVEERVPTDGLYALFAIRSPYGLVSARGLDMLRVRAQEQSAIETLADTSRREALMDGARDSAQQTIDSARKTISDPVGTITAIPEGVGRLFTRIGRGVESKAEKLSGQSSDDTKTRAGVAKARRQLAQKLNVDPYTDNPVLSPLLDSVAKKMAMGGMAVNFVTGAASVWAGAATRTANLVWNQTPDEVNATNAKRLTAMKIEDADAKLFLGNHAFTPTSQTLLVEELETLADVQGRGVFVRLAGGMITRDEARYLVSATRLLVLLQKSGETLDRLDARGIVPVAFKKDGTAVVPLPVDYLSWTDSMEQYFQKPDSSIKKREMVMTGGLSPLADTELKKRGWTVRLLKTSN